MTILSGIGGVISAAHKSPCGVLHGHTWEVVVWWRNDSHFVDAGDRKLRVDAFLKQFDHTLLPDTLMWGEQLAEHIDVHLKCCAVDVSRKPERIYARWERSE